MDTSFILVYFFCGIGVSAQSQGDVRLTGGTSPYFGRLDIFLKGKWGTFCGISKGGAQAACRQLGYLDATRYLPLDQADASWKIPKADNSVPIAIGGTSCDYSWTKGLLHILRCGYSTDIASSCSHSNDIVLVCEDLPLWQHPYNTQVRLNFTTFPSQGTLEIYLDQQWGSVCMSHFNQHAADSACRQMGYTNAESFEGSGSQSSDVMYRSNNVCDKGSCACLTKCFKDPHSTDECEEHQYVSVQCTFDSSRSKEDTSGNQDTCKGSDSAGTCNSSAGGPSSSSAVIKGSIIAAITLFVIFLIVVIGTVILVCFLVPTCYMARRRQGYTPVVNN